jgi:cytochrome c oxidase assembly protein subunit 11
MAGLAYAAAPLYQLFCRVTGYAGTPTRADAAPGFTESTRTVRVRFDANVDPALPWRFQPREREVEVKVGETKLVFFIAANTSMAPVAGQASFNVAPDIAGRYFSKIECFCFTEQVLQPGEAVDMPVSFFIDPAILTERAGRGLNEITLSYTFYRAPTATASTSSPVKKY